MILRTAKFFKPKEFEGTPHPDLLFLLDEIRAQLGPVYITSSGRTIKKHVEIYIELYGPEWMDKIKWESKHLPKPGYPYIDAVDFKVLPCGEEEFLPGESIKDEILKIQNRLQTINVGIGVAENWVHLDIGREYPYTVWYY